MTISDFQQWTKGLDEATKWDRLTTPQMLSHLMEEMGELARSVNRVQEYRGEVQKEHRENVKCELVDSLWFLVKIANRFGIDLETEVRMFVERADEWPVEKHQSKLIDGLESLDKELLRARDELPLGE